MIYNTENSIFDTTTNESSTSLLETTLYITESEGKMFDSLINIDFMDALNEADLSDQDEDSETGSGIAPALDQDTDDGSMDKKKKTILDVIKQIAKKIWDLLQRVGNAIKSAFEPLLKKLGEVFGTTNGLISKYGAAVKNQANLAGFPGLKDFPAFAKLKEADDMVDEFIRTPGAYENLIAEAKPIPDQDSSKREATIKSIDDKLEKLFESIGKLRDDGFETQDNVSVSANEMKDVVYFLSRGKETVKKVKEVGSAAFKAVDKAKRDAKQNEASAVTKAKKKADNDYAAAWKDYYATLAKISKQMLHCTKNAINVTKLLIKYNRRAMVEAGKYAYDKAGGKKVNGESVAFIDLLGYKSDVYVESVLEF